MKKIISPTDAALIAEKANLNNKKIVLTGGCFDILHEGHIKFLKKSKKQGDLLVILLESDENIKILKGDNRPVNSQNNRSIVLASLPFIDYVIPLKGVTKTELYDKLIVQIKPACITLTVGDRNIEKRKNQCKAVNAKLTEIDKVNGASTSSYVKSI